MMKKILLTLPLTALAAVCANGQAADAGVEATFANWADRTGAIYDVTTMSDGGKALMGAKEGLKANTFSGWMDTWGDVSRYTYQHADDTDAAITDSERVDGGGMVKDWPNSLFQCFNWWQWGSSIWQPQTDYEMNLTHFTPETHVHMAVKVFSEKAPQVLNIAFITDENASDDSKKTAPRFSLTCENMNWWYQDQVTYPVVGTLRQGDWMVVDITLGELDRLNQEAGGEAIDYTRFSESWKGRVYDITIPFNDEIPENDGTVFAIDAIYFYTPGEKKPMEIENVITGKLLDDATVDATMKHWEGKYAIYDVSMMGDLGVQKLDATEKVKRNAFQTYANTSGNWWRMTGVEDKSRVESSESTVEDWPNHLFQIDEWQSWGDCLMSMEQSDWDVNLSHVNADTRVHFALKLYRDGQELPQPINVTLLRNGDDDLTAPCFSIVADDFTGTAPYPIITGLKNGQWLAVDISLRELDEAMQTMSNGEKYIDYSRFSEAYTGKVYDVHIPMNMDNATVNNHMATDGIYLYTPQDNHPSGVESVIARESETHVTVNGGVISVKGAAGMEVYNMAGAKVAATNSNCITVENVGVYLVKTAGAIYKVIVK